MLENIQKAGCGRSPPHRTLKVAVASGNRPRNTTESGAEMCRSASPPRPAVTPQACHPSGTTYPPHLGLYRPAISWRVPICPPRDLNLLHNMLRTLDYSDTGVA